MASTEVAPPSAVKKTAKKPKPASAKKPKADPLHPSYLQMTAEALTALKERTGSSQYAIAKYIESKYQSVLPANFKKILSTQLKNLVKQNKLVKVKASYKLSEELKKQAAPKKSSLKKVTGEGETKKAAPKKANYVKKAPVKPKSTKSPKKAPPVKKPVVPKAAKSAAKPAPAAAKPDPAKKSIVPKPKKAAPKKSVAAKSAPKAKAPAKKPAVKKPAKSPKVKAASKSPKAKKPAAKKAKKA